MISETTYAEAYVWIWLPDSDTPVVAGRLSKNRGSLVFNYGRSYLARNDAIPIMRPNCRCNPANWPRCPALPCRVAFGMPRPMPGAAAY